MQVVEFEGDIFGGLFAAPFFGLAMWPACHFGGRMITLLADAMACLGTRVSLPGEYVPWLVLSAMFTAVFALLTPIQCTHARYSARHRRVEEVDLDIDHVTLPRLIANAGAGLVLCLCYRAALVQFPEWGEKIVWFDEQHAALRNCAVAAADGLMLAVEGVAGAWLFVAVVRSFFSPPAKSRKPWDDRPWNDKREEREATFLYYHWKRRQDHDFSWFLFVDLAAYLPAFMLMALFGPLNTAMFKVVTCFLAAKLFFAPVCAFTTMCFEWGNDRWVRSLAHEVVHGCSRKRRLAAAEQLHWLDLCSSGHIGPARVILRKASGALDDEIRRLLG